MAVGDTAKLVATLELQDRFSATANRFDKTIGNIERQTSTLGRVGQEAGRGLQTAARNVTFLAAAGGALLVTQLKSGIDSLVELGEATAQTEARIESTGGAANITAEAVRNLSQALEEQTTIDDKAIQRGQNMLLTFTNIRNEVGKGNDIFNQATVAVLDLATAMGTEPEQAALQLGKALNDPIRGLTALRRVGIQFTEEQEDQIKTLVESGRVMEAQKVILRELAVEFGGSARAFAEGPGAAQRRFADALEEGQQALARGLLPVLERFSKMAQDAFADPKVIAGIEQFGQGLGQGIERLIDIASRLPWEAIGSSLQIAGTGAQAVLTAFTSLPPWVQTAVLTGWGLNKLTGGALGNIAGTLGKAAFGALRGGTPATPVFTKEVGVGGAGGAPVAGGGGRLGGALMLGGFVGGSLIVGELVAQTFTRPLDPTGFDFNQIAGQTGDFSRQEDAERFARALSDEVGIPLEEVKARIVAAVNENGRTFDQAVEGLRLQNRITEGARNDANRYAQQLITQSAAFKAQQAAKAAEQVAAIRSTAQNTATQLSRIESVERITAGHTAEVARKNFSPNVNVTTNVSTSVSISDVQRNLIMNHFATDFRGGIIE